MKAKKEIIYRVRYEGYHPEDSYHDDFKTRQGFMKRYEIANLDRTSYIKLIDLYREI